MSPAHVVQSGSGRARRYLATVDALADDGQAHPPFTWIEDAARAVTFPSPAEAHAFGLTALGHSLFDVGPVPITIRIEA